jgi:hypothetical protein
MSFRTILAFAIFVAVTAPAASPAADEGIRPGERHEFQHQTEPDERRDDGRFGQPTAADIPRQGQLAFRIAF